jgi:hypothetical protein
VPHSRKRQRRLNGLENVSIRWIRPLEELRGVC